MRARLCRKKQGVDASERRERRGIGRLSQHYRSARKGGNPKTGEPVAWPGKDVPHFKPGKGGREKVDNTD